MELFPLGHGVLERQRHFDRWQLFVEHQLGSSCRANAPQGEDFAGERSMTGRVCESQVRRSDEELGLP